MCDLEHSQTFEKTVIIRVNTNGINCTSINYRLSILETVRNMSLELPHKLLTFNWKCTTKMSFSSEKSSRQTTSSSLPRQDTAMTVSSLSTSCSNLETNESTISSTTSTTRRQKNKTKRKSRTRRHSIEHFIPSGDAKTLKTLKVHYYPEEQIWSVVIVITATIVHMINHGLHLAYGSFLVTITRSFNRVALIHAGEF